MESTLQEGLTNVKDIIGDTISNITNPFVAAASGVAVGAAITGGIAAAVSATKRKRKKAASKRKTSRKRRSKHRKRRIKYARTAGKRKDTSHKRIRMTKNGQPYIIQSNGRARFISKSSARRSRKMKGGRY